MLAFSYVSPMRHLRRTYAALVRNTYDDTAAILQLACSDGAVLIGILVEILPAHIPDNDSSTTSARVVSSLWASRTLGMENSV